MLPLEIDDRGFPVPWFVSWQDGKPDFRVVKANARGTALKRGLCWVCGSPLGRLKVSAIGPMCVVNRVTSEPPSHPECARYAARACPFLSNPRMRRNEKSLPDERSQPGGIALDRNPGVVALWFSLYPSKPFPTGDGGWLFELGRADRVEWVAQGREATYAEVEASIASGLPALGALAAAEGQDAIDALGAAMVRAAKLLPPESAQ
jgi:hypothetical protein